MLDIYLVRQKYSNHYLGNKLKKWNEMNLNIMMIFRPENKVVFMAEKSV